MGTISTTLPSDGQTIDASDVNTPINAILSEFNGNIDDNNIKSGANINGSKLLDGSVSGEKMDTTFQGGWITDVLAVPNTVTYNGNRSYDLVFNGVDYTSSISAGMRGRTTRTVSAPTQCTSLNGTTQYYNKTSPNKLTFTDDFVVSAWVKLSSYGSNSTVLSRYNGTSGWDFRVGTVGNIELIGYNAAAGNYSRVASYQSIPLNKWVHITAQLDMSAFTATTTTSYVMIDGINVPAVVDRGGTNPTALVQAGNLEVGGRNGGLQSFPGKIAQVAIFNAKVTQATMVTYMSQGLSGSETSLASAYSFNNSITDLNTTTPNDLTAQGSAVATNADSPFGTQASGLISATLDYFLVQKASFSTNTTLTVQVPEGCTIPTSGGVSAIAFSTQKAPYGMPIDVGRWSIGAYLGSTQTLANPDGTSYYQTNLQLSVPLGAWDISMFGGFLRFTRGAGGTGSTVQGTISTSTSAVTHPELSCYGGLTVAFSTGGTPTYTASVNPAIKGGVTTDAQTSFYFLSNPVQGGTGHQLEADTGLNIGMAVLSVTPSYL